MLKIAGIQIHDPVKTRSHMGVEKSYTGDLDQFITEYDCFREVLDTIQSVLHLAGYPLVTKIHYILYHPKRTPSHEMASYIMYNEDKSFGLYYYNGTNLGDDKMYFLFKGQKFPVDRTFVGFPNSLESLFF